MKTNLIGVVSALVLAFSGPAAGAPANKTGVAGSSIAVFPPGTGLTILKEHVKTPDKGDLLLQVSLECAIAGEDRDLGPVSPDNRDFRIGVVRVYVEIDGQRVVVGPTEDPTDPAAGKVNFCDRTYVRDEVISALTAVQALAPIVVPETPPVFVQTSTDGDHHHLIPPLLFAPTTDTGAHSHTVLVPGSPPVVVPVPALQATTTLNLLRLTLDQISGAYAFNWVRLNLPHGEHEVVVKADLETFDDPSTSSAMTAIVGKRNLVVEPIKTAVDETLGTD